MIQIIEPGKNEQHLQDAVAAVTEAGSIAALTGAGISVESGIPDFRSPDGLWSVYEPQEYGTLDVFLLDPAKAWQLFRAMDDTLEGKRPNAAHKALARLESAGRLEAVITQNVDGLHQAAGSRNVIELHGDHWQLQCLQCGWVGPAQPEHRDPGGGVPSCPDCDFPLKPNVVLFGEDVRDMEAAVDVMRGCGALLVVGTSAEVYPAAGLPAVVKGHGGVVLEFNLTETSLTRGTAGSLYLSVVLQDSASWVKPEYLFKGSASETLTLLVDALLA